MSYKLIIVVKTAENETQSIYDKEDLQTAYADMHNEFGVAVKSDATLSVYCIVIDQETGSKMDKLYWEKVIIPAEEEEPIDISIRNRVYTHNDYQDDDVAPYDSEQLAIGNFHTKYASAAKKTDCNFAICIRLDGQGNIKDFAKKD